MGADRSRVAPGAATRDSSASAAASSVCSMMSKAPRRSYVASAHGRRPTSPTVASAPRASSFATAAGLTSTNRVPAIGKRGLSPGATSRRRARGGEQRRNEGPCVESLRRDDARPLPQRVVEAPVRLEQRRGVAGVPRRERSGRDHRHVGNASPSKSHATGRAGPFGWAAGAQSGRQCRRGRRAGSMERCSAPAPRRGEGIDRDGRRRGGRQRLHRHRDRAGAAFGADIVVPTGAVAGDAAAAAAREATRRAADCRRRGRLPVEPPRDVVAPIDEARRSDCRSRRERGPYAELTPAPVARRIGAVARVGQGGRQGVGRRIPRVVRPRRVRPHGRSGALRPVSFDLDEPLLAPPQHGSASPCTHAATSDALAMRDARLEGPRHVARGREAPRRIAVERAHRDVVEDEGHAVDGAARRVHVAEQHLGGERPRRSPRGRAGRPSAPPRARRPPRRCRAARVTAARSPAPAPCTPTCP